jgi:HK97 family phage prohead protease
MPPLVQDGSAEDDKPAALIGHAAAYEQLSEDLGGFREKIKRGAFKDSIKGDDIRALWNHDPNFPLGRTGSGTLKLREERDGLAFDITVPDTQLVRDMVLAPIDRGDVSQMSFGFITLDDAWEKKDGEQIRTLEKVQLLEISPVTFPAYPQTSVALRRLADWQREEAPSGRVKVNQRLLDVETLYHKL